MNERVFVLRDAVVKIAQMLSGKGIAVTQRGVTAYVRCDHTGRPTVVNLPYLPDNATEELCHAIQGFLDHEVAHIFFSDFTLIEVAAKAKCQALLNMLEDARIEKCMAKKFAGSGHNLAVTGKFFIDKYTVPMMQEAATAGDANKVIGILMVPLIRAMSGQHIFKEFMKDKTHLIQHVYDKISDLTARIEAADSTQACLDLAKEIEARLRPDGKSKSKSDSDPRKPHEEDDEGSVGDDDDEETSAKGKSSKKKPAKGKVKKSKKEELKKPEEEDPPAADPEEKDDSEKEEKAESEGKDGEPATSDDDSDAGEPHESSGESKPEETEGELGDGAAIWEAIDKENAGGFDKTLSSIISKDAIASAKASSYLVYTKEGDVVEPLKVGIGFDSKMFVEIASAVEHMVGPLQKDLERAIAARSMSTWESGRRSGRLHSANLSRLIVGDGRVFRRKTESVSKDVAVELVIDASGSMNGAKIHLATQAAYALSSVLERIGIQHEVICFTTGASEYSYSEFAEEAEKIGRRFSRTESLYMPILKGFNERLKTNVKERFGWLPNSRILRNNVDGECVEIAARRLLSRREASKVMIVLSDGAPAADGSGDDLRVHLKQVIQKVSKAGVNVVGIGIKSGAVRQFYPKSIVIEDVTELPTRIIKELRHLLIR
jgi:cobaltochelatase CobT